MRQWHRERTLRIGADARFFLHAFTHPQQDHFIARRRPMACLIDHFAGDSFNRKNAHSRQAASDDHRTLYRKLKTHRDTHKTDETRNSSNMLPIKKEETGRDIFRLARKCRTPTTNAGNSTGFVFAWL
jgi:hypothetical protein